MLRNGLYHTRIRSLQPSRLGALLLHLPAVWPRLEYLLQVCGFGVLGMDARSRSIRSIDSKQQHLASTQRNVPAGVVREACTLACTHTHAFTGHALSLSVCAPDPPQSGREGALKLSQAVGLSEAQFCRRFPEYSQWRSWNNGEEQVGDEQARMGEGCTAGCRRHNNSVCSRAASLQAVLQETWRLSGCCGYVLMLGCWVSVLLCCAGARGPLASGAAEEEAGAAAAPAAATESLPLPAAQLAKAAAGGRHSSRGS